MIRSTGMIALGASLTWALAVLGAIGLARWLDLSYRDAVLLVVAVAFFAIVGVFVPALRLARCERNSPG